MRQPTGRLASEPAVPLHPAGRASRLSVRGAQPREGERLSSRRIPRGSSGWLAVRLAALGISVGLFAISFPPISFRPAAWVALVPFLLVLHGARPGAAAAWGALWGVGAAYSIGTWLPPAVSTYFDQPVWLGFALFVFVALSMVAPYYAALAWWVARTGPVGTKGLPEARNGRDAARVPARLLSGPLLRPLWVAAAWAACELARGRLLTGTPFFIGNPWGLIGYSQVGWDPLMQITSATGIYGVGFLVALVNATLAELVISLWNGRPAGWLGNQLANAAIAAGLVGVALVQGTLALSNAGPVTPTHGTPVAIVQANLSIGRTWRSDLYGKNFGDYLRLTRGAADSQPAVVFWPESAMSFFLEEEPLYRASLRSVLAPLRAELVVGGPRAVRADGDGESRYYNTTFLVAPDARILGRYDKQYLVPFSEYHALGLDLITRRFEGPDVFTPGSEAQLLQSTVPNVGAIGVVTCNEVMLPEVVGQRVAAGAEILVNPSNDTWLADPSFSAKQFDVVTVRAIEQRRFLVRASTSGPSAVIDPWGRVQSASAPGAREVVTGRLQGRGDRTLYGRAGDAFGFACVAVSLLALPRALGRRTRL